jgi:NADH:ubiquinone reductase (H+-translocating)
VPELALGIAAAISGIFSTFVLGTYYPRLGNAAPFHYRRAGGLATIGRKAAVADFGWLRLSGAVAW